MAKQSTDTQPKEKTAVEPTQKPVSEEAKPKTTSSIPSETWVIVAVVLGTLAVLWMAFSLGKYVGRHETSRSSSYPYMMQDDRGLMRDRGYYR